MAKIALGTVQFGLNYGITNSNGQPKISAVADVLELAKNHGICTLDTAHAYGTSEQLIGDLAPGDTSWANIITKLPPLLEGPIANLTNETLSVAKHALAQSLTRLKRTSIDGLMTHRSGDLLSSNGDRLWGFLVEMKETGKVKKIGASVYSPSEAEALLDRYPLDIIQAPANIYDGRFLKTGMLSQLKKAGVEVHLRSIYLQGLLLKQPEELPDQFTNLRAHQTNLYAEFRKAQIAPTAACLAPYLYHQNADYIVIGCQNTEQLNQLVAARNQINSLSEATIHMLQNHYTLNDMSVLNPALWT